MDHLGRNLSTLTIAEASPGMELHCSDEVDDIPHLQMIHRLYLFLFDITINPNVQLPFVPEENGARFIIDSRRFAHDNRHREFPEHGLVTLTSFVLDILITNLETMVNNNIVLPRTIRSIYYQINNNVNLLGGLDAPISMLELTHVIDILTIEFNCSRTSLGVTSENTRSGYVGQVIAIRRGHVLLEVPEDASLVNQLRFINFANIIRFEMPLVLPRFVLIVEKLAIFQNLVANNFHHNYPCIMITGGGEPSVECRLFARRLYDTFGAGGLPFYYLGDCNPFGFEIFRTYKYGSKILAHMSKNLVIPSLRILGVFSEHLAIDDVGLLVPMTQRDISKAGRLLREHWTYFEPQIRTTLGFNMDFRVKANLEWFIGRNGITYIATVFLPAILPHW